MSEIYKEKYYEGIKKRGGKNIANIYFRNFILKHTPIRNRLLEIGCAKGEFLRLVEDKFLEVIALDISQYSVEKSKNVLKKAITFQHDIERGINSPFLRKPFDIIVSMHTFEHLYKPHVVLGYIRSLLAESGIFFMLVPNPKALKLRLIKIFDKKNRFNIFDDPTHYSFHDRATWTKLLNQAGFYVESYGRPFFYLKRKFLIPLYGDSYYNTGSLCETGPELVFVCRKCARPLIIEAK